MYNYTWITYLSVNQSCIFYCCAAHMYLKECVVLMKFPCSSQHPDVLQSQRDSRGMPGAPSDTQHDLPALPRGPAWQERGQNLHYKTTRI